MTTKKATDELEKLLQSRIKLSKYLQENEDQFICRDIASYINGLLKKQHISKAEAARRAKMSDVFLFQIISGRRNPSRDRLICLSLGIGCTISETQQMLKLAQYAPLYAKDRRDAIIMYGINNGWTVPQVNDALFDEKEETLL